MILLTLQCQSAKRPIFHGETRTNERAEKEMREEERKREPVRLLYLLSPFIQFPFALPYNMRSFALGPSRTVMRLSKGKVAKETICFPE